MLSLWKDFDRIGMPSLLGWAPSPVLDTYNSFGPVAVKDEADHVIITADMPGVDPKDLDVTLDNGSLTVTALRDDTHYRFSVYLGNEYDGDKIEAKLDKGVLTIQAEKPAGAKPRKIALKGADARVLESGDST